MTAILLPDENQKQDVLDLIFLDNFSNLSNPFLHFSEFLQIVLERGQQHHFLKKQKLEICE